LLHGRNSDPNPPLQEVAAWTAAVDTLETVLDRHKLPRSTDLKLVATVGTPGS
jgi:hypothetical protein